MLGNKIQILEPDDEFEKTRCLLIASTAGFSLLRDSILKKFRLKTLTSKAIKEKFIFAELLGSSELDKTIVSASNELMLNRVVFEDLISGWIKKKGLDYVSLPFYASSADKPLPDGFYIKISPYTTRETTLKTFKYIQRVWKDAIKASTTPNVKVTRRERKIDNLESKIRLFSIIEETILKHLKDAQDLDRPEYLDKIIKDSIEYASKEIYGKVRSKYAHDIYYDLQKYYNLPSYTDFKKLLISLSL